MELQEKSFNKIILLKYGNTSLAKFVKDQYPNTSVMAVPKDIEVFTDLNDIEHLKECCKELNELLKDWR